eukprot:TRINITY_DN3642_c0_g1_i1.p1 TRINITY_DN3642_c0_g1~~TRINITY_DN3642_c0_g1_i1.p1  ORF type:complete len:372 (-),score=79.64 TRINITY_DN3642_c0_g1_i1:205-1320(-)
MIHKNRISIVLMIGAFAITLALGQQQDKTYCSLEFLQDSEDIDATRFISFGSSNCVSNQHIPKTVELWVKPTEKSQSNFNDGVVFESGLITTSDGSNVSLVLAIKENYQLLGVYSITEKDSQKNREYISSTDRMSIPPNQWTHIIWHPTSSKFYINNELSENGLIYGDSLNGLSKFDPSNYVKVGRSFHGKIAMIRLWEDERSGNDYFMENIACQDTHQLISYWDFTDCKDETVSDFKGGSCGIMHPSSDSFLWDSMDAPHALVQNKVSDQCQLSPKCEVTQCRNEPYRHPEQEPENGQEEREESPEQLPEEDVEYPVQHCTFSDLENNIVLIVASVLFVVIFIVTLIKSTCESPEGFSKLEETPVETQKN